jgi:regulator of protease activity HflC (stomatin/prohibitin superfamily)
MGKGAKNRRKFFERKSKKDKQKNEQENEEYQQSEALKIVAESQKEIEKKIAREQNEEYFEKLLRDYQRDIDIQREGEEKAKKSLEEEDWVVIVPGELPDVPVIQLPDASESVLRFFGF